MRSSFFIGGAGLLRVVGVMIALLVGPVADTEALRGSGCMRGCIEIGWLRIMETMLIVDDGRMVVDVDQRTKIGSRVRTRDRQARRRVQVVVGDIEETSKG